jgi:hypothetical protein
MLAAADFALDRLDVSDLTVTNPGSVHDVPKV